MQTTQTNATNMAYSTRSGAAAPARSGSVTWTTSLVLIPTRSGNGPLGDGSHTSIGREPHGTTEP